MAEYFRASIRQCSEGLEGVRFSFTMARKRTLNVDPGSEPFVMSNVLNHESLQAARALGVTISFTFPPNEVTACSYGVDFTEESPFGLESLFRSNGGEALAFAWWKCTDSGDCTRR